MISDRSMPEMDGPDLARRVRAIAGEGFPVILTTGNDHDLDVNDLASQGRFALLNKPFRIQDLRHVLSSFDSSDFT